MQEIENAYSRKTRSNLKINVDILGIIVGFTLPKQPKNPKFIWTRNGPGPYQRKPCGSWSQCVL